MYIYSREYVVQSDVGELCDGTDAEVARSIVRLLNERLVGAELTSHERKIGRVEVAAALELWVCC